MAARRVSASAVDWLAFSKKVPKDQVSQFNAFKAKSDGYVMRLNTLPATAPAINWSLYENRVPSTMLAEFKKQYEVFTVPYPADSYTDKIVAQEKTAMAEVEKFVKDSEAHVLDMAKQLETIRAMMPIEEMNLEEYFEHFPDQALDPFDRPTMWPHTEDFQPEYIERMEAEGKFDDDH